MPRPALLKPYSGTSLNSGKRMEEQLIILVGGRVQAGFPSPAADYMEERIDLNKLLIRHPVSTFLIESEGDSMKNAFIPGKARLLIDRSVTPKNGDIILAVVNGEFTVKYLRREKGRCFLVPANEDFPQLEVLPDMNFEVWGVVTSILINPNDVACTL
jgi:DNA polymerase V